jgi:hypothetical protein
MLGSEINQKSDARTFYFIYMGEDWNVSSVNTIQVPKRKRNGMCLV